MYFKLDWQCPTLLHTRSRITVVYGRRSVYLDFVYRWLLVVVSRSNEMRTYDKIIKIKFIILNLSIKYVYRLINETSVGSGPGSFGGEILWSQQS